MDISTYSKEDLILTAMKSEIESKDVYAQLAGSVENFMLKDRLEFLAGEEEKHRTFFEWMFKKEYPDKEIRLPDKSPVPLPRVRIDTEQVQLSDILSDAMQAEMAAHDFYTELSEQYDRDPEVKVMLLYIAHMELGHYKILEVEKSNTEKFEDFDFEWPMMHVGP
jgi:rubrerythrin